MKFPRVQLHNKQTVAFDTFLLFIFHSTMK